MTLAEFMARYQRAWETSDEHALASLFAPDGVYHNTPFAEQRGHAAIAAYWQRTKLQRDIRVRCESLAERARGGIFHWHVTYQVASEELFRTWAASAGTNLIARKPGDPLPRLALDGVAVVEWNDAGLCEHLRLWWHSVVAD
ncbi:MAG TPA: nuclear transport factor 2 family protein [Casimicrobiaceae bacterium]|jgi:limonene-1,2-epoxide hydrolase|nr:nuclear transport factor 2 family protein [Casimicrobiaceae bacterium]